MPFNDAGKNEALKSGTGGGIAGIVSHIGIFQSSADPGTGTNFGGTEATGGSPAYARQAVTWGSPATGQVSNSGGLTFDVPAGSYFAFGMFNAVSGNTGNFRGYLPFGGAAAIKGFGTVDSTGVTNDTITSNGHGLANDDRVWVYNVFGESVPAGLTEGTLYYVVNTATDTFKLSLTQGGAAVNLTGQGDLFFQKTVVQTFPSQGQITVAAGQLVLDATAM